MFLALAMNNPALQFELGGTIGTKRLVADRRNGAIKARQIRQGFFTVVPSTSFLENKRSLSGLILDPLLPLPRQVVFLAQELREL